MSPCLSVPPYFFLSWEPEQVRCWLAQSEQQLDKHMIQSCVRRWQSTGELTDEPAVWYSLRFSGVFPLITRASNRGVAESALSSVSMHQPSLCLVYFSLLYVFNPLWHSYSFTYYPLCPCVFVFRLFFFPISLFSPHILLLPPPNHHPSCPQFPLLSFFLTFSLCFFFCRHNSFSLYLFSFIFFVTPHLSPTLPNRLMWEEDLAVRIVRSLNSSPRLSPGNSVFFFSSFLHHSISSSVSITQSLLSRVSLW